MFPMLGVRWTLLLKSGRFCRGGTQKMVVEKDQEGKTRMQICIRKSRNAFSFFCFSVNMIERKKGRREERKKEGIQTK